MAISIIYSKPVNMAYAAEHSHRASLSRLLAKYINL